MIGVRTLIMCGESMKQRDLDAWADHVQLVNAYGPSECAVASVQKSRVARGEDPRNIGTTSSACAWVVDAQDHERLTPIGLVGELMVEGPIVGRGYLNEPEKTAAVFVRPPVWLKKFRGQAPCENCYKTGDLVQYSPELDGSLSTWDQKITKSNYAASASNRERLRRIFFSSIQD